jgi:type IV pilus assembly protein PilE
VRAGGPDAGVQIMLNASSPASRANGFTLIETMVAVAIAAILASLSYPTFADQVRKSRRLEAVVRLATLQLAQERYRSSNASYGSLAQTGLNAQTSDGIYRLSVLGNDAIGYTAVAQAQGSQLRDVSCRFLQLTVVGGNTERASGPDALVGNAPALNNRCWIR